MGWKLVSKSGVMSASGVMYPYVFKTFSTKLIKTSATKI